MTFIFLQPAVWQTGSRLPCANMDLERLPYPSAPPPARAGQAVPYRAYSCRAGAYLPEQCFAPQPLVIVEGQLQLPPHPCGLL